jgi:hypothetical protein
VKNNFNELAVCKKMEEVTSQEKASIHCRCGAVQILFTSKSPRAAVECCDKQSYNNLKFLAQMGDYELPEKFPVLVYFFDNKLVVVKGIENLSFFKLIVESNLVNMYSSCCHTFLMSRNPAFAHSTVSVHGDRSYLSNVVHQKPTLRFFPDQLSEDDRTQLVHRIPGVWKDTKDRFRGDCDGWEEVYREFLENVAAPIAENQEGLPIEEILQENSEPIFVLGWQSARFARKTVSKYECILSG